jgi:hypothetical protein
MCTKCYGKRVNVCALQNRDAYEKHLREAVSDIVSSSTEYKFRTSILKQFIIVDRCEINCDVKRFINAKKEMYNLYSERLDELLEELSCDQMTIEFGEIMKHNFARMEKRQEMIVIIESGKFYLCRSCQDQVINDCDRRILAHKIHMEANRNTIPVVNSVELPVVEPTVEPPVESTLEISNHIQCSVCASIVTKKNYARHRRTKKCTNVLACQ